jgi:hypothetical protein
VAAAAAEAAAEASALSPAQGDEQPRQEEEEEDDPDMGLTWRERRALVEQLRLREIAELSDRMEAEARAKRRAAKAEGARAAAGEPVDRRRARLPSSHATRG